MSIERQFGSGVAWMAAGNWIEQAVNFAVFVLLARLLGAEAFGLLAMAAVFVVVSEFLVRETLSEYLISNPDPGAGHFNAAFWALAALGLLLSALLLLAAGPIAALYGQPEVKGVIRALSPTVLMIALTAVPVAILRRRLQFRTLALRAIAGVVAGGAVAIVMALNGFGVWALAAQRLVQVLVNIVMAWAAVGWRPGRATQRRDFAGVLSMGGKVLTLRAAEIATTQVPTLLIGALMGPVVVGFFSIAWRLVELSSFLIVTPLRMAAQPAFAAISRQGGRAADLLMDVARLSGLVAFPAFAGLAVLAPPLLFVLFGEKWLNSAPILSLMALLGAYFCVEKLHQAFCLAAGRAGAVTLIAWAEVALSTVLIWTFSEQGIVMMTGGFVAAFVLFWPLRFVVVARIAGVPVLTLMGAHLVPLLVAALMAVIVWIAIGRSGLSPLPALASGMALGLVVYGLGTVMFMKDRLALLRRYVDSARGKAPITSKSI